MTKRTIAFQGGMFQQQLESVNYQNPPWSLEYPELVHIFQDHPCIYQCTMWWLITPTVEEHLSTSVLSKPRNGWTQWPTILWIADSRLHIASLLQLELYDIAEINFVLCLWDCVCTLTIKQSLNCDTKHYSLIVKFQNASMSTDLVTPQKGDSRAWI